MKLSCYECWVSPPLMHCMSTTVFACVSSSCSIQPSWPDLALNQTQCLSRSQDPSSVLHHPAVNAPDRCSQQWYTSPLQTPHPLMTWTQSSFHSWHSGLGTVSLLPSGSDFYVFAAAVFVLWSCCSYQWCLWTLVHGAWKWPSLRFVASRWALGLRSKTEGGTSPNRCCLSWGTECLSTHPARFIVSFLVQCWLEPSEPWSLTNLWRKATRWFNRHSLCSRWWSTYERSCLCCFSVFRSSGACQSFWSSWPSMTFWRSSSWECSWH